MNTTTALQAFDFHTNAVRVHVEGEHGWLMKRNGIRNFPTQKAQDMGLFFVKAKPVQLPDGSTITSYTTKVTPKGQMYFINKFIEGETA